MINVFSSIPIKRLTQLSTTLKKMEIPDLNKFHFNFDNYGKNLTLDNLKKFNLAKNTTTKNITILDLAKSNHDKLELTNKLETNSLRSFKSKKNNSKNSMLYFYKKIFKEKMTHDLIQIRIASIKTIRNINSGIINNTSEKKTSFIKNLNKFNTYNIDIMGQALGADPAFKKGGFEKYKASLNATTTEKIAQNNLQKADELCLHIKNQYYFLKKYAKNNRQHSDNNLI